MIGAIQYVCRLVLAWFSVSAYEPNSVFDWAPCPQSRACGARIVLVCWRPLLLSLDYPKEKLLFDKSAVLDMRVLREIRIIFKNEQFGIRLCGRCSRSWIGVGCREVSHWIANGFEIQIEGFSTRKVTSSSYSSHIPCNNDVCSHFDSSDPFDLF